MSCEKTRDVFKMSSSQSSVLEKFDSIHELFLEEGLCRVTGPKGPSYNDSRLIYICWIWAGTSRPFRISTSLLL